MSAAAIQQPSLRKQHSGPRPRPRFDLLVPAAMSEVHARIRTEIDENPELRGVALDAHRFEIVQSDRRTRFWAPQLDVKLLDHPEGCKIMGRFGPNPQIWMTYLALYLLTTFAAIALLSYGVAQWMLGGDLWALYWAPGAVVAAALIYGASYVGQGLATAEMYELREYLEHAVEG